VLPSTLTPERMLRLVIMAATRDPKLYECTQESIVQALMQAAQLGLEINAATGEAYINTYWSGKLGAREAKLIPGFRGLTKIARRSGIVKRFDVRAVFDGDTFNVEYGTEPKIVHVPSPSAKREPANVIACYAVAQLPDGETQFDVMWRDELDRIKGRSSSKNREGDLTGPWVTDEIEMQKKTVVRRLCKMLPTDAALADAIELGDRADTGKVNVPTQFDSQESMIESVTSATRDRLAELKEKAGAGDAEAQEALRQAQMDAEGEVGEGGGK
jgi:recombination protein RecT